MGSPRPVGTFSFGYRPSAIYSWECKLRSIEDVAADLGLEWKDLEPYGHDKAKIPLESFPDAGAGSGGKLIVVTAITPTPAGEGKSTTAVGLTQGLGLLRKRVALTIRQPSLGPVFGTRLKEGAPLTSLS